MIKKLTEISLTCLIACCAIQAYGQDPNGKKANPKMTKETQFWYEATQARNSKNDTTGSDQSFDIISVHRVDSVNGFEVFSNLMVDDEFVLAKGVLGQDIPVYTVTFEVALESNSTCGRPTNTIIFEIPVTEDYYNSVHVKQEVTSWFKTQEGVEVRGDFRNQRVNDRWILNIIGKDISSSETTSVVDK